MGDEATKLSRIGAALYEDAPMKKMVRMSGGFDWPRRASLEHMTPAEVAIRNAVIEVEKVGAHPDLTAIVTGLGDLQDKLADYIDAQPDSPPTTIAPTGNVDGER